MCPVSLVVQYMSGTSSTNEINTRDVKTDFGELQLALLWALRVDFIGELFISC